MDARRAHRSGPRDGRGYGVIPTHGAARHNRAAEDLDLDGAISPRDIAQQRAGWSL